MAPVRYTIVDSDWNPYDRLVHRPTDEDIRVTVCGISVVRDDGGYTATSLDERYVSTYPDCSTCFPPEAGEHPMAETPAVVAAATGDEFLPYNVDGDTRPVVACAACLEPGPVRAFLHPERRIRDDQPIWRLRFMHEACAIAADVRVPWAIDGNWFGR